MKRTIYTRIEDVWSSNISSRLGEILDLIFTHTVIGVVGKPYSGKTTLLLRLKETLERKFKLRVVYISSNCLVEPELTIYENLSCPILMDEISENNLESRVEFVAERLKLSKVKDKYPHEVPPEALTRVTLGRALVSKPDILILDEVPLNAEDWMLLGMMMSEGMLDKIVYSSHSLHDMVKHCDIILILEDFKVVAILRIKGIPHMSRRTYASIPLR